MLLKYCLLDVIQFILLIMLALNLRNQNKNGHFVTPIRHLRQINGRRADSKTQSHQ